MITIEDQIRCVERELSMRRRAFPRWVAAKRMTQQAANDELARMAAVVETLKAVATKERLI